MLWRSRGKEAFAYGDYRARRVFTTRHARRVSLPAYASARRLRAEDAEAPVLADDTRAMPPPRSAKYE